ncbi:hypothetical protein WN55_01495 [Dufourea novaeangliae]|uniref:Uncharacterized protein n=1 Tax=Dufourea novaeangliae TaxID=178035 RepID=A0A154PEU9_DUFNO|nr:hypothetical protein WN55_01495 [Dufourea novaeangliae]
MNHKHNGVNDGQWHICIQRFLERDVIHITRFTTTDVINVFSAANIKSLSRCEGHYDYGDFNLLLAAKRDCTFSYQSDWHTAY